MLHSRILARVYFLCQWNQNDRLVVRVENYYSDV